MYSDTTRSYFKETLLITITFAAVAYLALLMYIILPLIFKNENQLPFRFFLPLIKDGSTIVWLINYIYQALILMIACEVLVAFDVTIFCLMNHCCWRLQILIIDIKALDEMIDHAKIENPIYERKIKHRINKICQKHCKTLEYAKELQKCSTLVIMIQNLIHMIGLGLILRTVSEVNLNFIHIS